jgi:hypothetical protein
VGPEAYGQLGYCVGIFRAPGTPAAGDVLFNTSSDTGVAAVRGKRQAAYGSAANVSRVWVAAKAFHEVYYRTSAAADRCSRAGAL